MGLGAILTPLLVVGFFVGFDRRRVRDPHPERGRAPRRWRRVLQFFASRNTPPPATAPVGGVPTDPATAAATPVALGRARDRPRRRDHRACSCSHGCGSGDRTTRSPRSPRRARSTAASWDSDVRGPRRRGRFARRAAPKDAVAAYRALLEDLEAHPALRREPGETPAEHARRLRREGTGDSRSTCWPRTTASRGSARWTSRALGSTAEGPGDGRRRSARRLTAP